ncbi:UPF0187 chloroplastic [Chlorella sorokiniana]|uniref:UPF0187 chloroplastic n=1 Tax=Chlorella sorokiniana TaxID=3076 RepID=A0A2P6TCP0_CHLSO|nr:UPF0187 chloroplastic [Chlorella sorokiniana]|eukprot:PRW20392.1 UPF0187 chloroplastic [Chlorella sorokiniana]
MVVAACRGHAMLSDAAQRRGPAAGQGPAAAAAIRGLSPCRRSASTWRLVPAAQRRPRPPMMDSILDDLGSNGDSAAESSTDLAAAEPPAVFPPLLSVDLASDPVKEGSRRYRRTVFDFNEWRKHRSTERYVRHMQSMTSSRMVRGLAAPLAYIFAVATAVSVYNASVEAGLLPSLLPEVKMASNGPFGSVSFAISLLLVFRTNASYARWLDARKAWGKLINRSRDLTRQALTYFPPEDKPLLDLLCRWTVAFSRTLKCHLCEDYPLAEELARVLRPHEAEALLLAKHRPTYCLQILSETLKSAHLPPPLPVAQPHNGATAGHAAAAQAVAAVPAAAAYRMDENLTEFEDIVGTCERILRAPIPLSYTRHTSRFMIIWLTLLPFALWDSVGWATVPLAVIVAFLLLGIEEIGVSIEEPFSILPLDALCDTIEANVKELQRTHSQQGGGGGEEGSHKARPPPARDIVGMAAAEAEAEEAAVAK